MRFFENLYNRIRLKKDVPEIDEMMVGNEEAICAEAENLLCFERAVRFCYASMEMMIHNRTLRRQCEAFSKWSRSNEEELERILMWWRATDSKRFHEHRPYTLPSDDLTMEALLSLGVLIAKHRLEGYQELRKYVLLKDRIVVNRIISHVTEEIKFFQREKEMSSVEKILNSLD